MNDELDALLRETADAWDRFGRSQAVPVVVTAPYEGPDGFVEFAARLQLASMLCCVRGLLALDDARRVVVSRVAVEPFDEPGRDIAAAVRRLRLGDLRTRVLEELRLRHDWVLRARELGFTVAMSTADEQEETLRLGEAARAGVPRPGQKGWPPEHWEEIAREALRVGNDPTAGGVNQWLARHRHASPETVKRWIRRLRKDGYLDPRPGVWRPGPRLEKEKQ